MCYFLYGSLYGDVSESEYVDVSNKYGLKISLGTKHDVKSAVKTATEFIQDDYRITDWICDCDSPVGKHDPADSTIIELSNLITEISALPGAKQINICKIWTGKQNKKINAAIKRAIKNCIGLEMRCIPISALQSLVAKFSGVAMLVASLYFF